FAERRKPKSDGARELAVPLREHRSVSRVAIPFLGEIFGSATRVAQPPFRAGATIFVKLIGHARDDFPNGLQRRQRLFLRKLRDLLVSLGRQRGDDDRNWHGSFSTMTLAEDVAMPLHQLDRCPQWIEGIDGLVTRQLLRVRPLSRFGE